MTKPRITLGFFIQQESRICRNRSEDRSTGSKPKNHLPVTTQGDKYLMLLFQWTIRPFVVSRQQANPLRDDTRHSSPNPTM
jgi:hypothetical protein